MAALSKEVIDLLGGKPDETTGSDVCELALANPSVDCRGLDLKDLSDLRDCK